MGGVPFTGWLLSSTRDAEFTIRNGEPLSSVAARFTEQLSQVMVVVCLKPTPTYFQRVMDTGRPNIETISRPLRTGAFRLVLAGINFASNFFILFPLVIYRTPNTDHVIPLPVKPVTVPDTK